jgi:hypothetical protein
MGSFGTIKHGGPSLDEKEHILEQIVCFCLVADNALRDAPYQPRVAAEKNRQGFLIAS